MDNGIERRRFPRAEYPCKIVVRAPRLHSFSTHTENIGCGGIRIIIEEEFKVGNILALKLFLGKDQVVHCKGKVVWAVSIKNPLVVGSSLFDLGLEFVDLKGSSAQDIQDLVSKLLESKNKEKAEDKQ